jgi:plasmid stabilization system protein ParE
VSEPAGRRLVVTSAAATDLTDAHDWYEAQSASLGAEFLRAVDAVLAAVQRTPPTFPIVHGRTRRALLRRFPYGVFFVEAGNDVVVLAVVHSRRHPRVWQSRAEG